MSRRRRQTRAKLLRAALELMAERGMEGVAINEITEAADLGFGTFYNYFDSKEAVYDALVEIVFEDFGGHLDALAEKLEDPAEVFASSVRYILLRTAEDPLWGSFLVRTGFFWPGAIERGLGPRMIRDLQAATIGGPLEGHDFAMTVVVVRGAILSAVDVCADAAQRPPADRASAKLLGTDDQALPERAAAVILRILGYPPKEAEEIANRPLPDVELPPNPLA